MIGRAAYDDPYMLAEVDQRFFASQSAPLSRRQVLEALFPYLRKELQDGTPLHCMVRPVLGLFRGVPGARAWRRTLSEKAHQRDAGLDVLVEALRHVRVRQIEFTEG